MTGLPVREEFFRIPAKPRGESCTILITGGSQGSRTLNQAARQSWPLFRKAGFPVRILHQTGRAAYDEIRGRVRRIGRDGGNRLFIADMPAAFAAADLMVCRSGAGAVSELAAAGKPSILVPFPFAADDHQTRNAEAMERGGAACLVRDAEMTGERLFALVARVGRLAGEALERMAAGRAWHSPNRAPRRRAAEILEEVASRLNRQFH